MTVSVAPIASTPVVGNNIWTVAYFSFSCFSGDEIEVIQTEDGVATTLALDADYTVTLNADQSLSPGGSITLTVAPTPEQSTQIVSAVPYQQPTELPTGGRYNATVLEQALDYLELQIKQVRLMLDGTVRAPTGETLTALLPAASRANKILSFDGDGDVSLVVPDDQSASSLAILLADTSLAANGDAMIGVRLNDIAAAARTQHSKNEDFVSAMDFMSAAEIADVRAGTLTLDVSASVQKAIDYWKGKSVLQANGLSVTSPYYVKPSNFLVPPGLYRCDAGLWFGVDDPLTDMTTVAETVQGYGAVFVGRTNGMPVVDLSGAFGTRWRGVTVFGDNTDTPNTGILLARVGNAVGDNPSAGAHRFTDVNVHGDFTLACVYNYGSEINFWTSCYFYQNSGLAVYYATNNNARRAVTSEYATIDTTVQSAYGDFFSQCIVKNSTGNATANGAVFYIESLDFGPTVDSCYIDGSGAVSNPAFWFRNAQGLVSAQTAAADQTIRISNNTFEYRAVSDLIVVDEDHSVYDMIIEGNSGQVNGAGGFYNLKLQSGAKVKNLRCQKSAGDTLGTPWLIGIVGSGTYGAGEIYGEQMSFVPTRAALGGTNWDYIESALTKDGAWHALNIASSLGIPTTARFAHIKIAGKAAAAAADTAIALRGSSATSAGAYLECNPSVNGIQAITEGLVPLVNGAIEYNIPATFSYARLCVRGYYI